MQLAYKHDAAHSWQLGSRVPVAEVRRSAPSLAAVGRSATDLASRALDAALNARFSPEEVLGIKLTVGYCIAQLSRVVPSLLAQGRL